MCLEGLFGFALVCKLFSKSFDNLVKSILQQLFKFVQISNVGFAVEGILDLLNPVEEVILQLQ